MPAHTLSFHHALDQIIRHNRDMRHLVADVFHERIFHIRMHRDRHVRGQGPRRGRPDQQTDLGVLAQIELPFHRTGICHRELDIHAVVVHVLVLQLRICQRGLIRDRPMHGLELFVDQPRFDKAREDLQRFGFIFLIHRQIWMIPIAQDPQALELLALDLRILLGVCVAKPADLDRRHLSRFRTKIGSDLVLDRQSVAIPSRHVRCLKALHALEAHEDILQRLVDHMPDVDVAICERRAVVQDPFGRMRSRDQQALVQVHLLPQLQPLGLVLHELGFHGEGRLGQVERFFVALFFCGFGAHVVTGDNVAEGFCTFE